MNDELPDSVPPQTTAVSEPNNAATPPRPRRLWPGYLLIAIYWAIRLAASRAELPITHTFGILAGSGALVTLLFIIWWLTNRTIAGRDRLVVMAAVVLAGAAAIAASQETLGAISAIFIGLPWVLTAWIIWAAAARRTSAAVFRWGAVVAVCLPWLFVSLIKVTGLSGDMKSDMYWRWTPTAEDTYLATRSETGEQSTGAVASPEVADEIVAGPGDWPGFRGPSRNGAVRGLSIGIDWDRSPPRQLWRQRIGPAWSSMVIVGGRLYTQEQVGEKEVVVCLDAQSGKRLWSHEDAARFSDGQGGPGPRATPEFAAGDLYTQGGTGILNCLNAASGRLKWSRDIAKDAAAPLPMWGFSSSPLVVSNVVITFAGGKDGKGLLAYHTTDGSPAWSVATGPISYSSPQPITLDGETQVVMVSDEGAVAVEPTSGNVAWRFEANGHGVWRVAQPTEQEDGSLLIGSEDLGTICLELRKVDGQWQPRERFRSMKLRPSFDDFVLYQGCAYGFDLRVFCCVDATSGKPLWRGGRYGNGQVLLLRDQGLLLITAESGDVVLVTASPKGHRELARFQAIEGKTWSHQAIANGNLYVRNDQEIACYRLPPPSDEVAAR